MQLELELNHCYIVPAFMFVSFSDILAKIVVVALNNCFMPMSNNVQHPGNNQQRVKEVLAHARKHKAIIPQVHLTQRCLQCKKWYNNENVFNALSLCLQSVHDTIDGALLIGTALCFD